MDCTVFGLIVADLIAAPMNLRNPPAPGGLHVLDSLSLTTGGNVPNVAIPMARFGMRAAAAGLVGSDTLGHACLDLMRRGGLDVSHVFAVEGGQTSASVVAVEPSGERAFFHTPGVTAQLTPDAFRRCFPIFGRSRIVQVGYFGLLPSLTPSLAGLLAELKRGAPGVKVALDTVNPPAAAELLWPILRHVDIFCPSRSEAAAVTGESDPRRMLGVFRKHMPEGLIAIKLDAEGCLVSDGRAEHFVPSYKIDVVDTTGAGDTWFGGLLTGLLRDMPLETAAKFANRAAADCCTALGASAGVKSFEETAARM